MSPRISARTRTVVLLGDPVEHSLSPLFQNAGFAAAGLDAVYVALRCTGADLPGLLVGIARAGGAGNVTVPHKAIAARTVERPTEAVLRTNACNTFWLEGETVCGDNTDVAGARAAIRKLLGGSPRGARVLLLGAGGSARAVVCALADEGAKEIVVVNRTPGRAEELRQVLAAPTTRIEPAALSDLRGESFDLAVNATSLGLRSDDPLPMRLDESVSVAAVFDLVYAPGLTPWVRAARDAGIPADDGLEMLLQQGAEAFRRWFAADPPLEAMRAALPPR